MIIPSIGIPLAVLVKTYWNPNKYFLKKGFLCLKRAFFSSVITLYFLNFRTPSMTWVSCWVFALIAMDRLQRIFISFEGGINGCILSLLFLCQEIVFKPFWIIQFFHTSTLGDPMTVWWGQHAVWFVDWLLYVPLWKFRFHLWNRI